MAQHQFYGLVPSPTSSWSLFEDAEESRFLQSGSSECPVCSLPSLWELEGGFFLVPASSQVRRSCCPSAAGRTQQRGMKEFLKNTTVSLGIWKAQTPVPESPLENTEGERVTRAVYESRKRTKSAIGQAALSTDTVEDSWAWTVMRESRPTGANEPQHELPGGAGAARSWSLSPRDCITRDSASSVVSPEQGLGRTHNGEKKPRMATSQAEGTHIWLQQLRPIK